ncbi:hypothetical protein QQ045_029861 [Rhodiola kirilowii]
MMQTPKVRGSSSEVPLKVSPRPRAARQLKSTLDSDSLNSSNQTSRTPKERSAATAERRSPRGSVTEVPKKSPSKISQLESQIAQLQLDISKSKEQLNLSETLKQQALCDAEESNKQILALNLELEESKKKFQELSALEEARSIDIQKIFGKRELEWQSKFDDLQIHHTADSAALGVAMDEIQRLKSQLETGLQTVPCQTNSSSEAVTDTHSFEEKLKEALLLVEDMKKQLKECKDSEAHAHALASETLLQLETARTAVETLQIEGTKSTEAYNTLATELEVSKECIKSLEGLVCRLQADHSKNSSDEFEIEKVDDEVETLKDQLKSMKSEVDLLRTAQEIAEVEELVRSTVQLQSATELAECVKSEATRRETVMEVKLEALMSHAAELKANLLDKETELQCITEENEALNRKIQNALLGEKEQQLEKELEEFKEAVIDLKANLMDKETEFQNILEENETLKSALMKKETDITRENDSALSELDAARTAEREAMIKLDCLKEEADRSSKRATRVAEQLVASQAANTEMEAELRKIKVQSDQWRKAAEVAASMISDSNLMERNGTLEGKCSPLANRRNGSPYSEDLDEDSIKKRNNNVLKKFGLSWKKSQK